MIQTMVNDVGYCDVKRISTERIESLLRSGRIEECREVVNGFFDDIKFNEFQSLMFRLYVGMDIYIASRSFSRELGVTNGEFVRSFGSIDEIASHLQTTTGAVTFFSDMISQCIRWRMEYANDNSNGIVRKAKDYIDRNYMCDEISLRSVANTVGLSPNYFSALFKKEVGQNFSDYLTKIRILKSKDLLSCTSKLIYEVAYEVGFRDYRYFSQIFKKHTGQTPREFQTAINTFV